MDRNFLSVRGVVSWIVVACAVIVMGGQTPVLATDAWSPPTDLSAVGRDAYYPEITGSSDGTKLTATW